MLRPVCRQRPYSIGIALQRLGYTFTSNIHQRPAYSTSTDTDTETIFALATAQGRAGVGVIRISGPYTTRILEQLLPNGRAKKLISTPRKLFNTEFISPKNSSTVIDTGMAVFFPNPYSFTGEDVAELHIHSSKAVIASLYSILSNSIRIAEPGEFTRRAFMNGKLDLTQVEGLADLLLSETECQRKLAITQMSNQLKVHFDRWRDEIIKAMAMTEAWIDFSEDELIESETMNQVRALIKTLTLDIDEKLKQSHLGEIIRNGFRVTLCGPPNAGKSSILNMLVNRDAAIVSPIAGTTRDLIQVNMDINGIPVILSDTAGIRDLASDIIEEEGIKRALCAAKEADHCLFVIDCCELKGNDDNWLKCLQRFDPSKVSIVLNKIDLASGTDGNENDNDDGDGDDDGDDLYRYLSAMLPQEYSKIRIFPNSCLSSHKNIMVPFTEMIQSKLESLNDVLPVLVNSRQQAHARTAISHLYQFLNQDDLVIGAEHLRQAANAIGRITGHIDPEDVLDVLFTKFCIGK
jgi:tRNA modification GTPase